MIELEPIGAAKWSTVVMIVILVAAAFVCSERMSARLVRSDPDTVAANSDLLHYAVEHGREQYRSHCLECHGERGVGSPSRGVPILADTDWLYGVGSVSDIERVITYGIRSNNPKAWNLATMPAFGRLHPSPSNASLAPLSPNQTSDVIEFLRLKQHRPADSAAAARGAQVYQTVGACYDCHSPDAAGDNAIGAPNLSDDITLYGDGSRESLYDSIANGRQGTCPAWLGVLSPLAIREVALYVYVLSHPDSAQRQPPL